MTWEPLSNIIADDYYSCAVYAKKFDLLNTLGWNQLNRHARAVSEPLRNPSTDKPRHPGDICMDGKFQEIMHMAYNLMFRMVITNGEMLLILRLNRSKNIEYSKIMARLSMRRTKSQMHPRSTRKLEYILCLMSNIVGIQGKTCGRWTPQQRTQCNCLFRS